MWQNEFRIGKFAIELSFNTRTPIKYSIENCFEDSITKPWPNINTNDCTFLDDGAFNIILDYTDKISVGFGDCNNNRKNVWEKNYQDICSNTINWQDYWGKHITHFEFTDDDNVSDEYKIDSLHESESIKMGDRPKPQIR